MPVTKIPLPFPLKGINTVASWSAMPPGTTQDALNVWPIAEDGRVRGAMRFGVKRVFTWANWNNTVPIMALGWRASITSSNFSVGLIIITDDKFFVSASQTDGTFSNPIERTHETPATAVGGSITTTWATIGNVFYYVSSNTGGRCKYYSGGDIKTVSANETAGDAPITSRLVTAYRNRLVLAGDNDNPYNFYCSRVGDPLDWDYSKKDPAAAFAGNFMPSGTLPDRIEAMIPRDDFLVFACERSIYRMVGDPGYGGELELITDKLGIAGPRAWTTDPTGAIWFASRQGLCRMLANGAIENFSNDTLANVFESLGARHIHAQLAWDYENKGCWIVISNRDPSIDAGDTPPDSGAVPPDDVYWFDERTGGFFKMRFGVASTNGIRINTVLMYDGVKPDDTQILFGATDGRIYRFKRQGVDSDLYRDEVTDPADNTATVSAAYDAYVLLGPIQPAGPVDEAMCIGIDSILGYEGNTTTIDTDVTIRGGDYPWEAINSPGQTATMTYTTGGKQDPQSVRMAENSFAVKVERGSTTKGFSLEQIVLHFQMGGAERNVDS